MSTIDSQSVYDALCELSSADDQKRLWLSTGADNTDVSSFSEAVEQLYTDTGLSDALVLGNSGFPPHLIDCFKRLETLLKSVENRYGPLRTIDDPAMIKVRELAGKMLQMLAGESAM